MELRYFFRVLWIEGTQAIEYLLISLLAPINVMYCDYMQTHPIYLGMILSHMCMTRVNLSIQRKKNNFPIQNMVDETPSTIRRCCCRGRRVLLANQPKTHPPSSPRLCSTMPEIRMVRRRRGRFLFTTYIQQSKLL